MHELRAGERGPEGHKGAVRKPLESRHRGKRHPLGAPEGKSKDTGNGVGLVSLSIDPCVQRLGSLLGVGYRGPAGHDRTA